MAFLRGLFNFLSAFVVLEKNPKYLLTVDQLFIWESFIIDERRLGKLEKVDGKERARICAKVEMIYQFFYLHPATAR